MTQQGGGGGVAEIQGLYGPFSFPEKLLQQIWLRGDFDQARARTTDGRPVRVLQVGRWNRLGGPDFKQARIDIGGEIVSGDVEIHLHASDWAAHGHSSDRGYERVVLHVILFPTDELATLGCDGHRLPILPLLPLLNHDLEEYAADEAIERLADHPLAQVRSELLQMEPARLQQELQRLAARRWDQKVHFAKLRVGRLGWDAACHHTALEILGYRFNRAPMLAVATAYPLAEWGRADANFLKNVHARFDDRWYKQSIRPANHPRARLQQYAQWVAARPDWPQKLLRLSGKLPSLEMAHAFQTGAVRRAHRWPELTKQLVSQVFGDAVGGTRLNTLICDGMLPLLASQPSAVALSGLWFAWPPGDIPAKYGRTLRELGIVDARVRPLSHGVLQGLIGWLLANESSVQPSCPTRDGSGA
ncbi:MAG: DUF2851 family protein [Nibricoccus sp.]